MQKDQVKDKAIFLRIPSVEKHIWTLSIKPGPQVVCYCLNLFQGTPNMHTILVTPTHGIVMLSNEFIPSPTLDVVESRIQEWQMGVHWGVPL